MPPRDGGIVDVFDAYMFTHTHIRINTNTHTHTYAPSWRWCCGCVWCKYEHTHTHMHALGGDLSSSRVHNMHIYVHTRIHTYAHTYMHTYIHIQALGGGLSSSRAHTPPSPVAEVNSTPELDSLNLRWECSHTSYICTDLYTQTSVRNQYLAWVWSVSKMWKSMVWIWGGDTYAHPMYICIHTYLGRNFCPELRSLSLRRAVMFT